MIWLLLGLLILGFLIEFIIVKSAWGHYNYGFGKLKLSSLRSYSIFEPSWPSDNGFMSLHFKNVRYLLLGIIGLIVIWFVDLSWLKTIVQAIVALLFALSIPLQISRIKKYKGETSSTKDLINRVHFACFASFWYPLYTWVIMLIGYITRP